MKKNASVVTHTLFIESLALSEQNKAFLNEIIKHGSKGASTFDLQAEQFGNITSRVKALEAAGIVLGTTKKDIIDKRGCVRRQISHRTFIGIDPNIAEGLI